MYKIDGHQVELEYREYRFEKDFPMFALLEGTFPFPKPMGQLEFLHFHNCVEIGVCRKGRQILYVENKIMDFQPGDICVIPPYAMHMMRRHPENGDPISCEYIYFQPESMMERLGMGEGLEQLKWYQRMKGNYVLSPGSRGADISASVGGILEELRKKDSHGRAAAAGYFLILSAALAREIPFEGGALPEAYYQREIIFPALSYMSRHFSQPMTVGQLAERCGMGREQFSSCFVCLMGRTPIGYLRMVRLNHACELLAGTEKKIIDVALESGFSSVSSFNRYFSEMFSVTPSRWRKETCAIPKKGVGHSAFVPAQSESSGKMNHEEENA